MSILGIDEAGRGPVLGPLIVCGVLVDDENKLKKLNVRDSKLLSPRRRKILAKEIKKVSKCFIVKIQAYEIDKLRIAGISLNEIERIAMSKIIKNAKPKKVIVDSIDIKPKRLKKKLQKENIEVIVEHKADEKYPVVSAASIVAKVERDSEIEKLKKRYNCDLGSGYPNDPKTIKFLKKFKRSELPDFVRKTWNTVEKLCK